MQNFFFCIPQLYLLSSPFWVRFLACVIVFNLTIEVVTFGLHGWRMLGVFLLRASARLGYECQDLFESVPWNACVYRLNLGLYSHPKEFCGTGVRTSVNSKGKIPSFGKMLLRGGSNPWHCITQDSKPNTLPPELFQPPDAKQNGIQCSGRWIHKEICFSSSKMQV